jgi:hypothetical protein
MVHVSATHPYHVVVRTIRTGFVSSPQDSLMWVDAENGTDKTEFV